MRSSRIGLMLLTVCLSSHAFAHGLVGSKVYGLEHYRPPTDDMVLGAMDTAEDVAEWINLARDEQTKQVGAASARWDTGKKVRAERCLSINGQPWNPGTGNWLAYDELQFWLHCDRTSQDILFIKVHCSGSNRRWGYWLHKIPLDFEGWRRFRIPKCDFEIVNDSIAWTRLSRLMFEVHRKGNDHPVLHLDDVRVAQNALMLDTPEEAVRAKKGDRVRFPVTAENRGDAERTFLVSFDKAYMEHMQPKADPAQVTVPPKSKAGLAVTIEVPETCPDNAAEMVFLNVVDKGDPKVSRRLRLRVGLEASRPTCMYSGRQIEQTKARATAGGEAASQLAGIRKAADAWDGFTKEDTWRDFTLPPYGFVHSRLCDTLRSCAEAYALTGERVYAEKAASIIRKYGDPKTGYSSYPRPPYVCTRLWKQNYMGVASWLVWMAASYDLICDAGVLSDEDKRRFEKNCLRVAAEDQYDEIMPGPDCGNAVTLDIAANLAVGFCLRDRYWIEEGLNGYSGWVHEVGHDIMDDGFWYEGSVSYHGLSIDYLTLAAEIAFANGIDLYHREIPTEFRYRHTTQMDQNTSYYFQAPHVLKSKTFRQAFEGWLALTYPNYQTPGLNDGAACGGLGPFVFQAANAHYGDPRYLHAIDNHTLLWFEPVKGEVKVPLVKGSTLLPTTGIACLRAGKDSEKPDFFAMLEYGIYGGGHGHKDRLQIDVWWRGHQTLSDNGTGTDYTDPLRHIWYIRALTHNTVIVDGVDQWPSCGKLDVFESTPEAEIASASCDTHYPGVRQRRTLMLTPDFLVDVNDLSSDDPHTYDLFYHCYGDDPAAFPFPMTPTTEFAETNEGYQCIRDVERGSTAAPFAGEFKTDDFSVRVHFPQEEPVDVYRGTWPAKMVGGGSVRFEVYLDDNLRYKSRDVTVKDWQPQEIDLDISGAKTLKLFVDAIEGCGCDHACWCDAKLYPQEPGAEPVHLSDLTPSKYLVHGGLRLDKDYFGGPIVVGGKRYKKGITLHPEDANGFMLYEINGKYRRFTATVGLDDGKLPLSRKLMFVRKQGKTARFVTVIEPYKDQTRIETVQLAGQQLSVKLADGGVKTLSLECTQKQGKLPFTPVDSAYRDPSMDNRPYAEGIEKDTITFPVEAWRYFSKTEELWRAIPCGKVAVEPGKNHMASLQTRVSPDFVQPAAVKLYEYDGGGKMIHWRYLDVHMPCAQTWLDWKKGFIVSPETRQVEIVICCRGVGVAWFTPPSIEAEGR